MNIRKILTLATAGTAAASLSIFGLGLNPAYAEPTSPVTFEVEGGFLVIDQTRDLLAAHRDERREHAFHGGDRRAQRRHPHRRLDRHGHRVGPGLGPRRRRRGHHPLHPDHPQRDAGQLRPGSGTRVDQVPVVGTGALVSATDDTIDSVFTYVPTAMLADQILPFAGSYSGNVIQTVV